MGKLIEHVDFNQPVTYDAVVLPSGADAQVAVTVAMMCRYVAVDSRRPEFLYLLNQLADGCDSQAAFIQALWNDARSRMYFQYDGVTGSSIADGVVEVLVRPIDVLVLSDPDNGVRVPADCDCHCMYIAAGLVAAGIPCSFATISASADDPTVLSHIYVVAWPNSDQRTVIDASHGPRVGWEAPNKGRYQEWPCNGDVNTGSTTKVFAALLLLGGAWWMYKQGYFDSFIRELN